MSCWYRVGVGKQKKDLTWQGGGCGSVHKWLKLFFWGVYVYLGFKNKFSITVSWSKLFIMKQIHFIFSFYIIFVSILSKFVSIYVVISQKWSYFEGGPSKYDFNIEGGGVGVHKKYFPLNFLILIFL